MSQKREIIFLNRAYNDLDTQLPLIAAFAEDERFQVRVIGYPCDGTLGEPLYHEAVPYIQSKYDVSFETVLDHEKAPFYLKFLHKLERFLFRNKPKYPVIKPLHVGCLMLMRILFKRKLPWLRDVFAGWNPVCVVMDEVFIQPGRSYLIDCILKPRAETGLHVYAIQTGHMIYKDPSPNKSAQNTSLKNLERSPVKRLIVPNEQGKKVMQINFPNEIIEVQGNLRMDPSWIKRLRDEVLVSPYFDKEHTTNRLPNNGKLKVVFMLSKLGYGVKLDEMKNTLRTVCNMEDVDCVIKPHTRAMKFDFMSEEEIGDAVVTYDAPSAVLIEWADIILMTGSSIVFHAMALNKRAGFLKNCQSIETIFDDGFACDTFERLEQLTEFLEKWRNDGKPEQSNDQVEQQKNWKHQEIYAGIKDGHTVEHYKKLILNDLLENASEQAA